MWRYIIFLILAASIVRADDVLLYAGKSTLLTDFQILVPESIQFVNSQSPANGTVIDRDSVSGGADPTTIMLNLSVPEYVPEGTLLQFRANLSNPGTIAGQTDLLLGENTTSGRSALLYYTPNSSTYAGDYVWFGGSFASTVNSTSSFIVKAALNPVYTDATHPDSTYFSNGSAEADVNVTTNGPETSSELNADYGINVNNTIANSSGATTTSSLLFVDPYWDALQNLLFLNGVGTWATVANATGEYFYANSTNRTFEVFGYMNITLAAVSPGDVLPSAPATLSCTVQDEFSAYFVLGANVSFFRNGVPLGDNLTDASGLATFSFTTVTPSTYNISCNVSDQAEIYYYAGDQREGSDTLIVSSLPPSFVGIVDDASNYTNATNEGDNVTFSANASDPESDNWYLLVCGAEGVSAGLCNSTQLCQSSLTTTDNITSCQHGTAGESNQSYSWWAYACDQWGYCSSASNDTSPYYVNHAPSVVPSLAPASPVWNDTLTCTPLSADPDPGDTVDITYNWWIQNESIGAWSMLAGQTNSTLESSNFDSNDLVLCQATPTDNHGLQGNATNSSAVIVANGTLAAASGLASTTLLRTQITTMNASCTVSDGDGEDVTIVIQDNRTGSFTQSSTSTAAVYVNASSLDLGRLAEQSAQRTVKIFTQAAGTYSFRAECQASDTNMTPADSTPTDLEVDLDTVAPTISSIRVVNIVQNGALVLWDTNKAGDSTVSYGNTSSLGNSTINPSQVISHSIALSGLINGTLYYYNVTSCNIDNYCSTSGPNSFTTTSPETVANPQENGYCTAQLVEPGPNYVQGYISKGDVYQFYCELPNAMHELQQFKVQITNKDKELQKQLRSPETIFGSQVVVYP